MKFLTKLYVDDIRNPPDDTWDLARSFDEAIKMLTDIDYELVSLDHDIASFKNGREYTGYDIVLWFVNRKINNGGYVPPTILVHSANPVGADRMRLTIVRYLNG